MPDLVENRMQHPAILVQKRCRFKMVLTQSMFAGEGEGSNPLAPIFLHSFDSTNSLTRVPLLSCHL